MNADHESLNKSFEIDLKLLKLVEKIPYITAIITFFVSFSILLAWYLDIDFLKSISPAWASMKANAALCFLFSSISLYFFKHKSYHLKWKIPAILVIIISVLTLIQYLLKIDFNIDQLLIAEDTYPPHTSHPGRMSPFTAISFLLIGCSLFLVTLETKKFKHPIAHYLSAIVAFNAIFTITSYIYNPEEVFGLAQYTQMAFHTSLLLGLMASAIFCLNLNHSLFSILLSKGTGGIVARSVTGAGFIIPFILGYLRVISERKGFLPFEIGSALSSTLTIFTFSIVAWWTALVVNKSEKERLSLVKEQEALFVEKEVRRKFISGFVHDLRTPLTAARLGAQMIELKKHDLNTILKHAHKITLNLKRTDKMIKDLLDVERSSVGFSPTLTFEECDISSLCQEIINELTVIYGDRIKLVSEHQKIFINDEAIKRIIENLISNAFKYGSSDTDVTITTSKINNSLQISVHNWGTPIPPDEQQQLFNFLNRTKSNRVSGQQGWGIGLTTVKTLVEAHHGKIEIKSSIEEGTAFIITIPRDARKAVVK